jgi:hypothetical protein
LTKMVGLHFGRFFSQTHLVALRGWPSEGVVATTTKTKAEPIDPPKCSEMPFFIGNRAAQKNRAVFNPLMKTIFCPV